MMSAKAGKRPLRSLTAHEKLEAIRRVHDGESKASVARDIGVPESTLRGWCKNEEKISYISRQSSPDTDDSIHGAYEPKEKKQKLAEEVVSPFNLSLKPSPRLSYSPGAEQKYPIDYIKSEDKPLNLNMKSESSKNQMSEREKNRAELARLSIEFGLNRPEMYSSLGGALADLSSNIGLLSQWNNLFMQQQKTATKKVTAPADTSTNAITSSAPLLTTYKTEKPQAEKSPKLSKLDPPKSVEESVWYWLSLAQNQANLNLPSSTSSNGIGALPPVNSQNNSWWKWYKQYTQVSQQLQQVQQTPIQVPLDQPLSLLTTTTPPLAEDKQILYQQLTKDKDNNSENLSKIEDRPTTKNNNNKARAVLDNLLLNNNNVAVSKKEGSKDEDDLSQSEALEHGEKFLKWLECCSEPSVTAMQIMQFRGLINNIKTGADRRNGDAAQKTKNTRLFSPATVISKKKAHAFEMMNLLTSLLLGRNYNAYNVYGFAVEEVTQRILRHVNCPFDEPEKQEEEVVEQEAPSKYALRPPRDLKSKFLQAMQQKEIDKVRKLKEKEIAVKKEEQAELEKPPPDELYGKRIHGWVLMMPLDEKDEMKPFFIEATTGFSHPLDFEGYCSIQSVWNNTNYWVNLQEDSIGVGNLDYNLNNIEKWEHILPGEPIQWRVHPRSLSMDEDDESKQLSLIMDEKHLDMPEPWSLLINIPHHDVVTRFPSGQRTTMYKRTIVQQYSPYELEDGLVMRIYKYKDLECTDLLSIEERYENRNDKLIKRMEDCATQLIVEYFEHGRDDNAKQHNFYKYDNQKESWRIIEFYHKSRYDCMHLLDHNTRYLTEHYIDREDKFYYRHVIYAKRGEPPPGFLEGPRRIITYVTEKFKRSPEIRASDDIAVREFDYIGREMHLKFHYDTGKITASTRTFTKPPLTEMVEGVSFHPELTYGYQAEIGAKPIKNSTLYVLLEHQIKEEEDCNIKIKHIEDGVAEFVRIRAYELAHPKLDIGLFNREQNKVHRVDMLEKERFERTKKEREIEDDLDFLKPYMVRFNCEEKMRTSQALKVREACLKEFKEILVWRANRLQKQFQDHMENIKKKHEWFKDALDNLTYERQQDYFKEMSVANYTQHIIELRLVRQKEMAPARFDALVRYLNLHPKLQKLPPLKTPKF